MKTDLEMLQQMVLDSEPYVVSGVLIGVIRALVVAQEFPEEYNSISMYATATAFLDTIEKHLEEESK